MQAAVANNRSGEMGDAREAATIFLPPYRPGYQTWCQASRCILRKSIVAETTSDVNPGVSKDYHECEGQYLLARRGLS